MSKFAKLFDVSNGDQVLIYLDSDENELPVLHIKTCVSGAFISATVNGFTGSPDDQWEKAESGIEKFDYLAADKYYKSIPEITEPV